MTTTEQRIKEMVNEAIPLTENCAIKRSEENLRRAKLRLQIEELLREVKPYDPRTVLK